MDGFQSNWETKQGQTIFIGNQGLKSPKSKWMNLVDKKFNVNTSHWSIYYDKMLEKIVGPGKLKGYLTHECALWSNIHERWFFCPRKFSQKPYDKNDSNMGTNLLISCDKRFNQIFTRRILDFSPIRGCTAIEFIPNSGDTEIICCRTIKDKGRIESYISIFDITGKVLLQELLFGKLKCVGIIAQPAEDTELKNLKKIQTNKMVPTRKKKKSQKSNYMQDILNKQIKKEVFKQQKLDKEFHNNSLSLNMMVEFLDRMSSNENSKVKEKAFEFEKKTT